jgi:enterochelin esterase-like enzyme
MTQPGDPEIKFRTVELSLADLEFEGLRFSTVKSPALGQRVDVTLHATPGAREARDVPVYLLLHGVYGSHWAWAFTGGAHRTSARLQAEGAIGPCVLAMPSDGLWGDGSAYVPHRTQDFERWIAWEVPQVARLAFPCVTERSKVCIGGLSMGGFGAMRIGGKHPRRFAAISGHSSVTEFEQLRPIVEESLSTYTALAEDRSVLDTLLRNRAHLPPLRFDCGTEDFLIAQNRELHAKLEAAGVPHTYEEFPGAHEWPYWTRHVERSLRFFDAAVRGR